MPLICRCSEYVKGPWSYIRRLIKFCRRPENGSRTGNRKYFANDRTFIRDHISLDKVPKCYMCWPNTSKSRLCKFKNARFASYGKKYSKYTKVFWEIFIHTCKATHDPQIVSFPTAPGITYTVSNAKNRSSQR